MDGDMVVKLVDSLVWPVTLLGVIAIFKHQLVALFERLEVVEAPGDSRLKFLNPYQVQKIIEEGQQEQIPPQQLAEQIIKYAELVDERELRILRALSGEEFGRSLHSYQRSTFYRPALLTFAT